MSYRNLLALLAGLWVLFAAAELRADHAEKRILQGHVVEKIENEIYISVGSKDEVQRGQAVRFKHLLALTYPGTRKPISDWLPVGQGQIGNAQRELSVVFVSKQLATEIVVGDLAEVLIEVQVKDAPSAAPPKPPVKPEPGAEEPLPTLPETTSGFLTLWNSVSGSELDARIRFYNDYLRANPDSPYIELIQTELRFLYEAQSKLDRSGSGAEPELSIRLDHKSPVRAFADFDLPLIFVPDLMSDLSHAWLHYRRAGAATYKRRPLRVTNARYLRGEIPTEGLGGSAVEYFVDVGSKSGTHGNAVGSPRQPLRVVIDRASSEEAMPSESGRTRLSFTSSYLDFATFDTRDGNRTDTLFLFEGDVLYRLRRTLYGIRMGFGMARGEGGRRDVAFEGNVPTLSYQYGYGELEFHARHSIALIGRLIAGTGENGFELGTRTRVRLGEEQGSNLSAGFSTLPGIGFLTDFRMQWLAVEELPIGLSVGLTDQPGEGDLGLRLTTDVGWQALDWMRPTLRISYQGRSVDHSGLGAGAGVVFDW